MAPKSDNSYNQILKSTSVYGGVQVFGIITSILSSKAIAILLGPAGMGLANLLTSTTTLISGITNFGLGTSAVKNVAAASATDDEQKLRKTVAVFRRLVWITGGLGFVITLIFAPWLSEIAFGNKDYSIDFMLISVTLLFVQISSGQNVILQGMRKVKYLAKANILGSVGGLLISIPLYYFWAQKGIVPAIILSSLSTLLLSWYFANKIKIPKAAVDREMFKTEGKEMLKMGFLISMTGLMFLCSSYIVRIFISHRGGLADVGLFGAGFAIIGKYTGLVFTAMGKDYYPRLSVIAQDNAKCEREVNQQAEIAILILAPMLTAFLVYIHWAVVLLYSKRFLGIVDMIHWSILGIFFQALSWSLGYILLAKGASKVYFWNELAAVLYMLGLNILGYYYWGLTGLGISFLLGGLFYFIQIHIVCKKLYGFSINKTTMKIFIVQFLIASVCFIADYFFSRIWIYSIGTVLILVSGYYSWHELNKRIPIRAIVLKKIKR